MHYTGKAFLTSLLLSALSMFALSAPETFDNPILPGFYPDPSITRAGDTYYMTNSTFEWFPALPIHKSKDLVNWELIGHGLTENNVPAFTLQEGLRDSLGIFAPTIRFHKGTFYIVTTCVGCKGNLIISAKDPAGPWSSPVWIKGAVGIDPSLYWENGKSYYLGAGLLNNANAPSWPGQNGVWMQEISLETGVLKGEPRQLTFGHAANARWAEGPRLFKVDGEYLLLIGEGGTNEFHAVTVFNSQSLWGPYEPNHANPVLTHRHLQNTYPITQTGHADLIQTPDGDWWSVLLAKRPLDGTTLLSRETFLASVKMQKNESGITPIYNPGVGLVKQQQKRPRLPWSPSRQPVKRDEFNHNTLSKSWNMLRTPNDRWFKLENGTLVLNLAAASIDDLSNPAFLGRRFQHHSFTASTRLRFITTQDNETAGLVLYRRSTNHYQLVKEAKQISLIKTAKVAEKGEVEVTEIARTPYGDPEVILHVSITDNNAQFSAGPDENTLTPIGAPQPLDILSDEINQRFNGNYVGMYASSHGEGSQNQAFFEWFEYEPTR